jgi:hypothetical protein
VKEWKRLNEIVRITSQWVTVIGERWLCDKGKELEYWRVEKVDSVIVLPIQAGHIFCVSPTFRPGIGYNTLDFPGGRLPEGENPQEIVPFLLQRELGIDANAIQRIQSLNAAKWNINSAFSNQGLWGFVAEIDENSMIPEECIGLRVTADSQGIANLLTQLDCLQCRAVLLEYKNTLDS